MDILYVTRRKNIVFGWNDGKEVFRREFDNVHSAKMFIHWLKYYLSLRGSVDIGWLKGI